MNPTYYETPTPSSTRVDLYRPIHKALRACLCDTLVKVGSMDSADIQEVAIVLNQVRVLVTFCESHLAHKNAFIRPAVEGRFPAPGRAASAETKQQQYACSRIMGLSDAARLARPAERALLVAQLYQHLAMFLADNLQQMNLEETEHNALLWSTHRDGELRAIEQAIGAALTPEDKAMRLRWMLPALTPDERLQMLERTRSKVSVDEFNELLDGLCGLLRASDWRKLMLGLYRDHLMAA